MIRKKLSLILLASIVLVSCTSWMEEHERAMDRARVHSWNTMMEEHHSQPKASGPKWELSSSQAQDYLDYLQTLKQQDINQLLMASTATAVNCELNEPTKIWLMYQQSPADLARSRAVSAQLVEYQQLEQRITLLSGTCDDQGQLNGPVSAIYQDNSYSRSDFIEGKTQIDGRIDGYFSNGVLDGEIRVIARDTSNYSVQTRELRYYTRGIFDEGKPVGHKVMLAASDHGDTIFVTQALMQNRARVNTWMTGDPNTRYYTLNNQIDGWMEFASAVLQDSPSCYRAGQPAASSEYCQQIAAQLEQLAGVEPPSDYGRLEDIPGIDASAAVASVAMSTTASTSPSHAAPRVSRVPSVGYYDWLNPPRVDADMTATIQRLRGILSGDVGARLQPVDGSTCALTWDIQSQLVFQKSAADHADERANQARLNYAFEDSPIEFMEAEGNCVDGQLDGDFVVYYRYQQKFTAGAYKSHFDTYGRVEGALVNGALQGEIRRTWLNQAQQGSMAGTEVGASLAEFEQGERVGTEVHLIALPQEQSTRTIMLTYRDDKRELMQMWMNDKRQLTSLTNKGINDGFVKYFDPALNNLEQCYRDGELQSRNDYCEALAL